MYWTLLNNMYWISMYCKIVTGLSCTIKKIQPTGDHWIFQLVQIIAPISKLDRIAQLLLTIPLIPQPLCTVCSRRYSLFSQSGKTTLTLKPMVQFYPFGIHNVLKLCYIVKFFIVCMIFYPFNLRTLPKEESVDIQTHTKTDKQTDTATYRLNWPKGLFNREKI